MAPRVRSLAVPIVAVALLGVVLVPALAALGPGPSPAVDAANASTGQDGPASHHPPDPESDVLGWEAGYWYNESISVTPEDGLNDSELDAVVSRGMARVEEIRRLEFEERPPVEIITREDYQQRVENRTENTSESDRLHQNVKYEALLMVNESTDAIEVQADNSAGGTLGFYDPSTGEIKIVSEDTETPRMDEITLSQELFHALQDQHFDISSFNQSTQELHNARDGIIEGDGNYVDHLYNERCDGAWNGTCLRPSGSGAPSDFRPHFGLYQIQLQPYSDGPLFVRGIRERGGWEAVNDVYQNPPASTEQTIHPERYGADEPTNVSVSDRSDDRWRVLDLNGSIDFASFGEAGLYVTLWYPAVDSGGVISIIPAQNHINYGPDGQVADFDPYNYNHSYTAGWDGDKLVPYVTNASRETNETGYVYRTVWDSPADAAAFQAAYERLLRYHGAEVVAGHRGTFRIPEGEEFADAFYLNRSGDTFTIVNAPNVSALEGVRAGAAPAGERTPFPGKGTDAATTTTTGPGFTALLTLLALLVLAVAGRVSHSP